MWAAGGCGMPAGGRCPRRGGGLREACGMPAGGRCPVCGGRPRNARGGCEDRGPARAAACVGRGTPAGGRCPARGGGLREACGGCEDRGPACTAACVGRRTPAEGRCPACAAACGTPAGGRCPARGGGLREACEDRGPARAAACVGRGTPAGADAPRVRRPAWAAERPRKADAPPAHNAGGTHSASPQTVEQSFARGLPGRGSAGPSARRGRPPANPAACAVYQAS